MARQARYPAHPGYTRTGRIGPTSNLKVGQVGLSVASAQVQAYIFARLAQIDFLQTVCTAYVCTARTYLTFRKVRMAGFQFFAQRLKNILKHHHEKNNLTSTSTVHDEPSQAML